tara:strand:+ start:340 stop:477 length:138 start_codon:yes stop_codon:yes gene_type:complete
MSKQNRDHAFCIFSDGIVEDDDDADGKVLTSYATNPDLSNHFAPK